MAMEIKSLIIEHRPRLQSANFFIRFASEEGVVLVDGLEQIEVVLRENSVAIKRAPVGGVVVVGRGANQDNRNVSNSSSSGSSSTSGGDEGLVISTAGQLDVLTNSLSALVARDGYLSFRVNTNSKRFGVELLSNGDCDRVYGFDRVQPNVLADQRYVIRCGNCTVDLGRGQWTRIFELPSGNFDSGDWFCHKTINLNVGSPKEGDLFYGYYYAVVHGSVLDGGRVVRGSQLVHCKRCLQFLGQRVDEESCGGDVTGIKIWNENVRVVEGEVEKDGFILKSDSLMGDFKNLLRKIVHDFEFVDEFTSLLPTMHKVLVKSFRTDSSREVPSVHLLVQVMEMSLDLLEWVGGDDKLRKRRAMKVLYCYVDAATKDDQLLKYWTNDQNVHPLQVSPRMFETVLGRLRDNSKLIPDVYRFSCGFELSYILEDGEGM